MTRKNPSVALANSLFRFTGDLAACSVTGGGLEMREEYAIFGSTPLILAGIIDRDPGDVDIAVSKRVWGQLLDFGQWEVQTPNAGDPPILVFDRVGYLPIHLFYEWSDPMVEIDIPKLIKDAWIIEGYRCATLKEILRHKRAALSHGSEKVQKHRPDIAALEEVLGA